MGRFLVLSALALALVSKTLATPTVQYAPVTGVSQDGSCGNGVTCVGSGYGNCCSVDGVCGSTDEHCSDGCQPLFGICPASVLNKRYAEEGAEMEKRDLEARATSSLACRSAGTTTVKVTTAKATTTTAKTTSKSVTISLVDKGVTSSSAGYTCVASKTSIIRAATAATAFCSSWNANKPHTSSPFTSQGILMPTGVSNACSCILADTAYVNYASTSSAGYTCVPAKTSIIRAATSATAFCSSWNANKPHTSSPFSASGILLPTGVSNACSCILADTAYASATTAKSTSTTTKAPSTTAKATSASTTTTKTTSTTTSAAATSSACALKKRRRRRHLDRRLDHATAPAEVISL